MALYVAGSLLLAAAMAYGGCEVAAIPALIFRRRLVVYCPFNAVDAAERSPGGGRVPGCSRRGRTWPPAPAVRVDALGSLALTGLALGLSGILPTNVLWGTVMGVAFLAALGQVVWTGLSRGRRLA